MNKRWIWATMAVMLCLCVALLAACVGGTEAPQEEPSTPTDTPHVHAFGDWQTTLAPTCTQAGQMQRECACGVLETRALEALGHAYDGSSVVAPTCTQVGYTEDVCSRCGDRRRHDEVAALGHDLVHHEAQEPTPTEVGWLAYDTCTRCDYSTYQPMYYQHYSQGLSFGPVGQDAYAVVDYFGTDTEVVIPAYYKGHPVTQLRTGTWGPDVTSISLPDTLTVLGDGAFADSTALASLHIPASVEQIGMAAFVGCSAMQTITVDADNPVYHVEGNCLIETATRTVLFGCREVDIPADVMTIGAYAFCGSGVTRLVVPEGVTTIGDYAFANAPYLTEVVLPASLEQPGRSLFVGSLALNTLGMTASNATYRAEGNCLIDWPAAKVVYGCAGSVIPDGIRTVGAESFAQSGLCRVVLPASVREIEYSAFASCGRLFSVTVGRGVTDIGNNAFGYCYHLVDVCNRSDLPLEAGSDDYGGVAKYALTVRGDQVSALTTDEMGNVILSLGDEVIYVGYVGTASAVRVPDGVSVINDYALMELADLTEVVLPDSVRRIGRQALFSCSALTSLRLGSGLRTLGEWSLAYCTSLRQVVLPEGLQTIEQGAFKGDSGLGSIVIPDSVTEIAADVFLQCVGLYGITIGSGVTAIGDNAFGLCMRLVEVRNRSTLPLTAGSDTYGGVAQYAIRVLDADEASAIAADAAGFVTYAEGETRLLLAYQGEAGRVLTLPEDVTAIAPFAFYANYDVVRFDLPAGLASIGAYAFDECLRLQSLTLPDLQVIANNTFDDCRSLQYVVVQSILREVQADAFFWCDRLEAVYYMGTAEQWQAVQIDANGNQYLLAATVYAYSAEAPTEEGAWWHYDAEGAIAVW